jgi:hypothetical protein
MGTHVTTIPVKKGLSSITPDANQGVKYYFRNGIAISDTELDQLRQEHRKKIWQEQENIRKMKQDAANRTIEQRIRDKADADRKSAFEAEQRRIQLEQDRIKRSRPVMNTD